MRVPKIDKRTIIFEFVLKIINIFYGLSITDNHSVSISTSALLIEDLHFIYNINDLFQILYLSSPFNAYSDLRLPTGAYFAQTLPPTHYRPYEDTHVKIRYKTKKT